jgi:glycosyltransferase involved in cell wall biosynthesis
LNTRRSLLFFSPCTPDPRGTGWEQRAYSLLLGYSRFMDVDAWFMPTLDNPDLSRVAPMMSMLRSATAFYPVLFNDPQLGFQRRLMSHLAAADVVHVSRLPQLVLNVAHERIVWDIDELPWSAKPPQSGSRSPRVGRDAATAIDPGYERGAARCRMVLACSPLERLPAAEKFMVIPNVVAVPPERGIPDAEASAANLLFVGNLNYLPNIDALAYLQADILPPLLKLVPALRVTIAGRSPATDEAKAAVDRLRRSPQFEFVFDAPDLAPCYRRCALAIAPIRLGGGTRIKIVESFAHRRAVVSTTKGCEGLEVEHGTHLLIADTPGDFAARCAQLLRDAALRERLAGNAHAYFETRHTQTVVDRRLAEVIDQVLAD